MTRRGPAAIAVLGPGLLVAATGVGAGDLATAGFAGGELGLAVAWAVVVGAAVKLVLNEGLARWQLATGETLLEGALRRLGPIAMIVFGLYLFPWTFFTCGALMSACGVTAHGLLPVFDDPDVGKLAWGAAHSAAGVAIVWMGGFRWFERIMAGCIAVMFVTVVVTAVLVRPDWSALGRGLVVPTIPRFAEGGLTWTIGLMGGVGGTLTILCYGYWIREKGRSGADAIRACRIDLLCGYAMTAMFGVAMVVIASGLKIDGSGSKLIVDLAGRLEGRAGPAGRWVFLIGAWAAVFSSLLGVWHAVPLIFADFLAMVRGRVTGSGPELVPLPPAAAVSERSRPYRVYLLLMATVPLLQVGVLSFRDVQKYYAVLGAAFIPLVAVVLLMLVGGRRWVGDLRNRWWTNVALVAALLLSALAGVVKVVS